MTVLVLEISLMFVLLGFSIKISFSSSTEHVLANAPGYDYNCEGCWELDQVQGHP